MTTQDKILVGPTEAARLLSVSRSKLYELVKCGTIPKPIKLGKCSRWPVAVLQQAFKGAA